MKKIFLFIILCFGIGFGVKAQEFKAGITAGLVASQVDGDRMGGYYKAGFIGGLYVYRDFGAASRMQAEILYAMKGSRCSPKNTNPDFLQVSTTNVDISLSYIYKVLDWLNFRIGLTPSVLLTSSEITPTGLIIDPKEAPAFRTFGVLGLAGVTYNLSQHLTLTWTYNYSLYSIRSGESEIYSLSYKEKNAQHHNYMAFSLGYTF